MFKKIFFIPVICAFLLASCEGTKDDGKCDISTLNKKGSATINDESQCYDDGSLIHDQNNDVLILTLRNQGNNDNALEAKFTVPAQGFNFNTSYPVAAGSFEGLTNPSSNGSIILEEDNYPSDPTLMKYRGSFNLTFGGSALSYQIDGEFSFEKP